MEESTAMDECNPILQLSEENDESRGGDSEIKFIPSPINEKDGDNCSAGPPEGDVQAELSTSTEELAGARPSDGGDLEGESLAESSASKELTGGDNSSAGPSEGDVRAESSTSTEELGTSHTDMHGNNDLLTVKNPEETDRKTQYQRGFQTLLDRLHLQGKYEQKFTPADFLKIGSPVKQEQDTPERDLAHTFLQRLMMLDYRARYIPVRQESLELRDADPAPDAAETDKDDMDALYSTSADSDQSKHSHVHPMDVQMAVYHCSDHFFKQSMATKLSQCQYALPLLVPDPVTMDINCPLWTFRQIRKTWKTTQINDKSNIITTKSIPVCEAETPMVSFFRLGSPPLSKSHLMNTLINERHNTFFHRNCPGSTKSRCLMDGVAEIAWYCPAGKPTDAFTDCIAFCNLHGDALLIEKQRDILTEKSSVNVVLVPTLEKGDKNTTVISALYKSPKPLILLIADNDGGEVRMIEGKYKMGLKDRSQSNVSEELRGILGKILPGAHVSFKLETMAQVSGIRVDENDAVCQEGKSAAIRMVNILQGTDVSKIKEKFLPHQGQLWHEWCRINKELNHLKGDIEKDKNEKQDKLKEIREKQLADSCSELMKIFIKSFSSLASTEKKYFLKWTQILLDTLSADDLSLILQSYDEKWTKVLTLKKRHDKSEQLKNEQKKLDEISTKLQSANFGLEHIFREMGQIYEAHAFLQTKEGQTDWSKYPELAADLMISGYPMELLDGDAGHVPLTWISSLLDEVRKKLGDQRVFVLSVLGLQSSGKSTMLNAMFGLQFAVSAGRCTKGAFMQLVKVSKEIKKNSQFDYFLVVDTEGLRALELADNVTHHHDNELATFVVGLGNMTLINIFGENPADMQDILQIVVQAFMRMRKVKLSPSCVFVHQNVTDIGAAEKNMDGKRRLQDKLDQMSQLAAKEEVCEAECFSDVIAFDVQKDVKFFAQLWEGSPPMAPPNPGYSESIQELKNFILSKASESDGITLSHFERKIQDLWEALINENFVFSFKNTLEIAVYRKLEVQYGNWTWTLRSHMLTTENQLHIEIENGKLVKIELSYLHETRGGIYEEIKRAMTDYFDDDKEKEILVQWRGQFEIKMNEFYEEQVRGLQRRLDKVIQQKSAHKKLDEKKTEFENKLLQKSKELAHQLKDKVRDEKELEKQFDAVWSFWVKELIVDTKPIEDINLEQDQMKILQELSCELSLIYECKSSGRYKQIAKIGDYSDYVKLNKRRHTDQQDQKNEEKDKTGHKKTSTVNAACQYVSDKVKQIGNLIMGGLSYEEQQLIRSFIGDVEEKSLDSIKSKPVAARGYNQSYLQEVAKSVKEKVTGFEEKILKRKCALKKDFTVDLILYVFYRAESWLSESHKEFKKSNDEVTYLESKKTQYYNIFRSFCKGSSSAVVLGELICEKLKSSTVEAVCIKTAIELANEMRCNFPAFNGNRLNLEKHVLKSLAVKEDFDGFITYIQRPREKVETFIKEEVNKYVTGNKTKAQNILKKNAEDIKQSLSRALFTATEKVKTQKGSTKMWLEEFSCSLKDVLTFDTVCHENFSDINNFDFLKDEIEKGFEPITNEMKSLSLDKIGKFRVKPDEILIDQLCNCCWERCPFCAAVCTNTLKGHSPEKHSVPFHRSSGINGVHFRNTEIFFTSFCTSSVASDRRFYPKQDSEETVPYKEYQRAGGMYATWEITPDKSELTYWKWFVCRFQKQLEDHYKLKFQGEGEIPKEWSKYKKEEAIKSLDEMYKK